MQVESTKIYSGSKNYDLDVSVKSSSIKPHTAAVTKFSSISNGTLTLGSNPNLTTCENASTTKNAFDKAFLKSWFAQRNNLSEQTSIYFKYKSALASSTTTNHTKEESANSLNLNKFNRSSSNSNISNENSMYSLLPLGNLKNNNLSSNNDSNNEKNKILPKIVSVKADTMPITSVKNNSINLTFVSPSTNNLSIANDTNKPTMSKFSKVSVGDTDVNSILNSFYSSKSTNSATKSKPIRQILARPPPPSITTTTINSSLVTKEEPKVDLKSNLINTSTNQISHVPKNENKTQNQEKDLKNQNSQNNEKNEKFNYLTPSGELIFIWPFILLISVLWQRGVYF